MRLVFAGTPAVALPALAAIETSDHELAGVLTRPDAPAGRGRRLARSPVAAWADERGLPVLQPARPGDPTFLQQLIALAPDCCPVVAYGALIPRSALDVPPYGWVNLHFSVLPAWRGAAPVQRALMAGDEITGASTFRIEEGLDTGPVLGVLTEPVRPDDTAGDLLERLSVAGARLLVATLAGLAAGALRAQAQPGHGVSLAPKVTVEEARVDWSLPAAAIDRRIRGCTPQPGAWTTWRGQRLGLDPVRVLPPAAGSPPELAAGPLAPGQVAAGKHQVLAGTATGPVALGQVRPHGRRPMSAADWARGVRPEPGERLG